MSAAALAQLMNPVAQKPMVDVSAILKENKMENAPQSCFPPVELYQKLKEHSVTAKAAGRRPFIFVELTGKDTLPAWLSPDAVGGKLQLAGDEISNGSMTTNTLSDMATALRAATTAPRFF